MRKRSQIILLIGVLSFIFIFQYFNNNSEFQYQDQNKIEIPIHSSSLEGIDNIHITELIRRTNLSATGLINLIDKLTILNKNDNPINSILIGVPLKESSDLIYIDAQSESKNSLTIKRSYGVLGNYEMIIIYFDVPLLPSQDTTIFVKQSYINKVTYNVAELEEGRNQIIQYDGLLFPILPYRCEGDVKSYYLVPTDTLEHTYKQFEGMGELIGGNILYDLQQSLNINHLDPFLTNLHENNLTYVAIKTLQFTGLEVEKIDRKIFISPWGIIKNTEEIIIKNVGAIEASTVSINIPKTAKNVKVYDELGELDGAVENSELDDSKKILTVALYQNRVPIIPDSVFKFFLEYNLPHEEHVSYNWFQQSVSLNLLTTTYDFVVNQQTTKISIEGCGTIDYVSSPPEAIYASGGTKILVYSSEYVSSIEKNFILFTYSVDVFDLIFRPIIFMMIIGFLSSMFVLIIKTRKRTEDVSVFKREFVPTNEIREFCSLYEEKNALILEIRKAENEIKRKKMAKKTYKNLLTKNTIKIDQIKDEILPFKKTLMEISETYNNIIKKLDVLDAERTSVNDALNLLESRYKRGKLPSKAAYQKLSDNYFNRRRKIDRTIDKYIQQLRSYLL